MIFFQNGSTPRHIAQQQGHQVVAEILSEYEKRLLNNGKNGDKESNSEEESSCEEGAEGGAAVSLLRRKLGPPPVCQDVTASPRNSPKRFPRKGSGDASCGEASSTQSNGEASS